ncbi:MAG: sigma-54 dependent transcriptional regulator [Akkermansiaceae bacterium]|jgi:two-component system, NtrC family, response regulator AtoC|nr:sigma-54 dependent transcriptional regulator [Akkermansiaceae bacterium]MDP4646808.1 sigma-54 dependent transcriptional regulator [Akkermansiaceae bacterium]MDP4719992.1 sigma-54 dependent transcriptional regulator [Akkermansiaceae bacterium]MDP4779724.1 sigma-54 dependent transcriptional regulator [Akkermansiaceae bacterium]MDP4846615.1 sigma-54 dependent transcriptional regulator [Akkermansiaceae bacterium]
MLPNLLIVDDELATREGLRSALEEDFEVYTASDNTEAMTILRSGGIELMLTDLRLGGDSGMDLIDSASKLASPPVILMMTAYGSVDTAVEAMRRGAFHFVTKPLNLDEVEMLLKRALRSRTLETENIQLTKQVKKGGSLSRIIGKSPEIKRVTELIEQVAPTRATVLIEGESGTGKEIVANAIHQLSGRPAAKLVTVNCAALSSQLLESELFGHEKGSFTGAAAKRIGRFEQADGGTLFLDEIGEIDPATQVKLLRVLSERSIERVGSNSPIKVDVRLIAATNRDLRSMVDEGTFREDLFFRLNVISLKMPTLRDRPEDIILLANAFLREFAVENERPVKPLSDAAIRQLLAYNWPGNVRELRTAIEHGVVMSNDPIIDVGHLPNSLNDKREPRETTVSLTSAPTEFNLHSLESGAIRRALAETSDNRTQAAELLGISRRTLQRKIKELGL